MNATTKTERHFLLDRIAGWRTRQQKALTLTRPDGYLTLDPLPGRAALLLPANEQQEAFVCPSALAIKKGRVFVTDAATHLVRGITMANKAVETLPSIGGLGSGPRRLREPRGVAVTAAGTIIISDTANHRIQVFSPPPYALLQVWGATDGSGNPAPGDGPREFKSPWAAAVDDCGTVYVVDRGNRRIQKIALDGTYLGEVEAREFRDLTRLALGSAGRLAVVDRGHPAIFVFEPGRSVPHRMEISEEPRSVAFDDLGNLYIGDSIGLIHVFAPAPLSSTGYRLVGAGDTHLNGEIIDLAWEREAGLVAIINEDSNAHRQRLWQSRIDSAFAAEGGLVTEALDSGIEGCLWHRALLDATVPERTSLLIESFTSENLDDQQSVDTGQAAWETCMLSGDDDPDCLIQSLPGRYLWLRLTFRSNGLASPVLRRMKVFFPRQSYLQYLPAVFQEDEESRRFLDRFLSIFQTEFDGFDKQIDDIWQLFDPASVPERHLNWLAGWLALDIEPEWKPDKKRRMLKDAFKSYLLRGTAAGIEQAVRDYADVQFARIIEHYKLRRWPALYGEPEQSGPKSQPALPFSARLNGGLRLWSRNFYHRLQVTSHSQVGDFLLTGHPEPVMEPLAWGAHRFTVFFPADPYCVEETEQRIARVVRREKPAHTEATLCPVLPRMRVGVQASVGVDSVVGGVSHLVLNHLATLNYDTILACSSEEQQLRGLNAAIRPRTGLNTRVL